MLVLRRKEGERLLLGEDIKIEVLAVEGDRVKLGIEAPPEVTVVREELAKRLEEELAKRLEKER